MCFHFYRFLIDKLLYAGDIVCYNSIGQGSVDDHVVLGDVLEHTQDRVDHDADLLFFCNVYSVL